MPQNDRRRKLRNCANRCAIFGAFHTRKPYRRESCKAFYVLHDGKQYRLRKSKEEAEQAFHKLMAGQIEASPKATVNEVVSEFLSWTEGHRSPLTYEWYCQFLDSFTALYGQMRVTDLKPYHVRLASESERSNSFELGTEGRQSIIAITWRGQPAWNHPAIRVPQTGSTVIR